MSCGCNKSGAQRKLMAARPITSRAIVIKAAHAAKPKTTTVKSANIYKRSK